MANLHKHSVGQEGLPEHAQRLLRDLSKKVGAAIPDGTPFPLVLDVGLQILSHVVMSARPEGRDLVLRGIRASIDLIEAKAQRSGH